jgi:predicted aldo/keto reductase-like oxidoreductase
METVRLGKTNLKVSRIGMGGIPIQRPTEAEAIKVVRRALDLGVNWIDTALGYGTSEERIGKAIADRRDQVIVATKTWVRDKATALEQLEQSLKNLNTDYIDIWQFHNVGDMENYRQILDPGGAMEAAQEALQAGKVRHIGFSSHSLDVALEMVRSDLFETVQFPFNFMVNEIAEKLIPLTQEHDVGFIAMKPLGGGGRLDVTLAIKFLLQFETIVPDPGIQKVEEIEEVVDIVNGSWKLTEQDWQEIEHVRATLGTRFCRWCEYCAPCPQGVWISVLMNLPSGIKVRGLEQWLAGSINVRAVETGKNCIQCGECEAKCPYHLPIREMIAENIAFYERMAAEHSVQKEQ